MRIALIIPYFGKFPPYFDLFLESCSYNKEIEFLIYSDQKYELATPSNVQFSYWEFAKFKDLVSYKLKLTERARKAFSPYKLCDYKPAYGKIFEDYLRDFDYWGFCDVDLIFGRIFDILKIKDFLQNERILTQGHLTFYKNTQRINSMFLHELKGTIKFRQAIEFKEPAFFDEIFMPAICRDNKVKQYGENVFADILPQYATLTIAPSCAVNNEVKQRFYWRCGHLFQTFNKDGQAFERELIYIHFQKRPMQVHYVASDLTGNQKIYFTPQGIYPSRIYTDDAERENRQQTMQYQKKRWRALTIKKVWVKYMIVKLKIRKL